jgi:hypothetical protein
MTNMRLQRTFRSIVVFTTCLGIAFPVSAATPATAPASVTAEGIPVRLQVEDVRLHQGELRGAIVDVNGKPVASAPVAVGQAGKVLAELNTDSEGRFAVKGMKTGTYQVASYAGVQNYRLWNEAAPSQAKQGIIHVLPEGVARANSCDSGCDSCAGGQSSLCKSLGAPLLVIGAVAAAVAITVAVADDDDDAS